MLDNEQNSTLVGNYIRENGLRLIVQVIIFLFAVITAYYAIKQDIALLTVKVDAVDDARKQDRMDIMQRLDALDIKIDKNTDRVIEIINSK